MQDTMQFIYIGIDISYYFKYFYIYLIYMVHPIYILWATIIFINVPIIYSMQLIYQ